MGARNRQSQNERGRMTNTRDYKVEHSANAKPKWEHERKAAKVNIIPKTDAQRKALNSFESNILTVLTGSAGTRKDFNCLLVGS